MSEKQTLNLRNAEDWQIFSNKVHGLVRVIYAIRDSETILNLPFPPDELATEFRDTAAQLDQIAKTFAKAADLDLESLFLRADH